MARAIYKQTQRDGRNIREHRAIMQEHLGRKLTRFECVHHKNENPRDDRIENLELVPRDEHSRLHHPLEYPRERTCPWCGVTLAPPYGNRNRQVCCSKPCSMSLRWQVRKGRMEQPQRPQKVRLT